MNLKLLDVGRNTLIKQQLSKQALVATRFDWALDHRGVSDATSEKKKKKDLYELTIIFMEGEKGLACLVRWSLDLSCSSDVKFESNT